MAYKDIDDKIIEAANTTTTASAACAKLGMRISTYKKHATRLGVYRTNQGGKGNEYPGRSNNKRKINLDEVLRGERPETQTGTVKRYLLREGIKKNECEVCGIKEWMGAPLSCHLDHINGVSNDHRLENLRMICPNCHSQTNTYCGKNARKGTSV